MNLYTRIGMYSFIIGALLSVLDSAFLVNHEMHGLVYVLLVFFGLFAGLLNITEDEEHHFLLSGVGFLIVVLAFNMLFAGHPVLTLMTHFFQNAVAFVGSMTLVVAIKVILEFGSQNYHVTPEENMEARTAEIDEWQMSKKLHAWHFTVFLAVAATFVIILLGMPIYTVPPAFEQVLVFLEWIVIGIFVIDLFVLYKEEGSWSAFFQHCWIDIVATIPIPGVFGALKIVRVARVARLARMTRVTHSLKFFSQKSGVNTYLREKRRTENIEVAEHPRAKQKKSYKKK